MSADAAGSALADVQQRIDHSPRAGEPVVRLLGQGLFDDFAIAGGQRLQAGPAVQMLRRELGRRLAGKRQHAGEHLLIDDRQAVLIAARLGAAVEDFRRGIDGRHAAHHRGRCDRECP